MNKMLENLCKKNVKKNMGQYMIELRNLCIGRDNNDYNNPINQYFTGISQVFGTSAHSVILNFHLIFTKSLVTSIFIFIMFY